MPLLEPCVKLDANMSRLSGETWNGSSEGEGVLAIAESVLEKEERNRKERRKKKKKRGERKP